MSVERRRYIGAYGRKHRTAHVPGVGNLYLNELVEVDREAGEVRHVFSGKKLNDLTPEALATLYGDEFASADTECTYELASGAICDAKRVPGTVYCELHGLLAAAPGFRRRFAGFRLETPDVLIGFRHICRFCHEDFWSEAQTDDICPTCLARIPVDDDVPSPSDSPQTPPPKGSDEPDDQPCERNHQTQQ